MSPDIATLWGRLTAARLERKELKDALAKNADLCLRLAAQLQGACELSSPERAMGIAERIM